MTSGSPGHRGPRRRGESQVTQSRLVLPNVTGQLCERLVHLVPAMLGVKTADEVLAKAVRNLKIPGQTTILLVDEQSEPAPGSGSALDFPESDRPTLPIGSA